MLDGHYNNRCCKVIREELFPIIMIILILSIWLPGRSCSSSLLSICLSLKSHNVTSVSTGLQALFVQYPKYFYYNWRRISWHVLKDDHYLFCLSDQQTKIYMCTFFIPLWNKGLGLDVKVAFLQRLKMLDLLLYVIFQVGTVFLPPISISYTKADTITSLYWIQIVAHAVC